MWIKEWETSMTNQYGTSVVGERLGGKRARTSLLGLTPESPDFPFSTLNGFLRQ
jgi:hypothetical protein